MKKAKKIFHVLSSVLLYSLLVIMIVVSIMFAAYGIDQYIGTSKGEERSPLFGAYVIISPSMVPNINVYDAVVTMRVSPDKIKLHDVITFLSNEINTNGTPITHRVVGIVNTEDGKKVFRTKGDNNESEDRALIKEQEILGKVMLRIPMIGYVKTFLTSKIGWLVVIVVPCLFIIGSDIMKLFGLIKKKDNKEDNSDIPKNDNEIKKELLQKVKEKEEEFASGRITISDNEVPEMSVQNIENTIELLLDEETRKISMEIFGTEVIVIPDDALEKLAERKEDKDGIH